MRSRDLARTQAARVKEQIRRQLAYLIHLVERMQQLGFEPIDPLYSVAVKARDAQQDLHTEAMYAGIKHGVAKLEDG
jgi:Asp-tRNA(Asn)/Glu-tRNA(Gln) amidotransferase C subunit